MKKLVFMACFMAIVAMTFASCNCGTSKCEVLANDSDSIAVVDTTVVDSLVVEADSIVAE